MAIHVFFFPSPLRRTQSEQSQWHTHCIFQTWADFPPPSGASQQQPPATLSVLLGVWGAQVWGPLLSAGRAGEPHGEMYRQQKWLASGGQEIGNIGSCGPGLPVISSIPGTVWAPLHLTLGFKDFIFRAFVSSPEAFLTMQGRFLCLNEGMEMSRRRQ